MKPEEIKSRLEKYYTNSTVEVVDLTGTLDHYHVSVVSKAFEGKSRVQAHRQVMDLFQSELQSGELHAFTISTQTPK